MHTIGNEEACVPICPVCGSVLLGTGLCFHCFKVDALGFEEWWQKEGCALDPSTTGLPWRKGLVKLAFEAGIRCAIVRYVDEQQREFKG